MNYDIITFDCYGTLVDWREGIGRAFLEAAAAVGCTASRDAFLDVYASIEADVQRALYRPYRDVLRLSAARVMERVCRVAAADGEFLPASLGTWLPFPDTNDALIRLRAGGHRLGILSNVDRDLLARTRGHLSVPFDLTVTAEDVRSYKPAHAHFEEARRQIGDASWLHVAQSWFHDVVPCAYLGIPVVWINRLGERPTTADHPEREFASLSGLADWLVPATPR
jgi:2-haloalkanoic acid dehalogenase type II